VRIIDAYATATLSEALNLKIGLTKIPLTRVNLDDCFGALSQDRSMFAYSAYGTSPAKFSRDMGVVAWGGFNEDKLRYYVGAFQGREGMTSTVHPFSGATVKSSIEPKDSLEWVGRMHYAFLDAESGSGNMGSYLGQAKIFTIDVNDNKLAQQSGLWALEQLAYAKRRLGRRMGSHALQGDGALSGIGAATSLLALAALALYDTLGWWQADRIAALVVAAIAGIEAWRTTRPRRPARSDSVRPG
jgi:hypothetical protein